MCFVRNFIEWFLDTFKCFSLVSNASMVGWIHFILMIYIVIKLKQRNLILSELGTTASLRPNVSHCSIAF